MARKRDAFAAVVGIAVLVASVTGPVDARAQGLSGLGGPRVPNPPGTDVSVTADGQTQTQPVGQAEVEIAVELGGGDEAEVGKTYNLVVSVQNNSPSTAAKVRVPISLAVTTAEGAVSPARSGIRYAGADSIECVLRGDARVCPFGDIPSGETRTAVVRVDVGRGARPGRMTFSAAVEMDSQAGQDSRVTQQKAVALVLSARRRVDADLQIAITREAAVAGPGERFAYMLDVRNTSAQSDATEVDLELRYRMGVRESGKLRRIASGARWVVTGEPAPPCTATTADVQRCRLGTLRPREVRRVTVELAVVHDLEPGQWGRIVVDAAVSSAENDPAGANNLARAFTTVVSRLPAVVIVTPMRNDRGAEVAVPVDAVAPGQVFGVEARFMTLDVEPTGLQPSVRVSVDGGEAFHVTLSQGDQLGSERVFRSPLLRIVAPGPPPPAAAEATRGIRAAPGSTVRVVYELPNPLGGPSRAETTVTVRPAASPRTGAPRPPR